MSHTRRRGMPRLVSCVLVYMVGALVPSHVVAQASPQQAIVAKEVSLDELLRHAQRRAPSLAISVKRQGYAAAERAGAVPLLRNNPVLEAGVGPRFDGATDRDFDFYASLSQPVEIAGERGLRLEAADQYERRLGAETAATRWQVRRDVTVIYYTAAVARARVRLAERCETFAEELQHIAQRRLAAGDATKIDLRLAETELARVRQAKLAATQEYVTAQLQLAALAGYPAQSPPNIGAELTPPAAVPSLTRAFTLAAANHPALRAGEAMVDEAATRVALAEREAWPTPSLGVQVAREGSAGSPANYVVLGTLGVPLPLWQTAQGERARRRVDRDVAEADQAMAQVALRAQIARAHAELSAATGRLALFTSSVAPQLAESLDLLRRGFEAGELPLVNVSVARERFLAAESEALDAYADYYRARAELEYAVGTVLPVAPALGATP